MFHIRYTRMDITVRLLETADLPSYKVSAIRGGIGQALIANHCIGDRNCDSCPFEYECIVRSILYSKFKIEPRSAGDGDSIAYLIECDDRNISYLQGDLLTFRIYLFGDAIVHVPQIVQAIYLFGQYGIGSNHVPFSLCAIKNLVNEEVLTENGFRFENWKYWTLTDYIDLRYRRFQCARPEKADGFEKIVEIVFLMPCTLKFHGEFLEEFQEEALLNSLFRRIYMLNCYEGNEIETKRPDLSGLSLISQKVRMESVKRYSSTSRDRMILKGMSGKLLLNVTDPDIMDLIFACELAHIGKNARFGLGKFRVLGVRDAKEESPKSGV